MKPELELTRFDIVLLDDDININTQFCYYATIGNSYGLQCNLHPESKEYNAIRKQCEEVHRAILKLKQLAKE